MPTLLRLANSRWLLAAAVALLALPLVYPSLYWLTILSYLLAAGLFALSFDLILGQTGILSFGHAAAFGLGAYAVYWVMAAGYPYPLGVAAAMLVGAGVNVAMGAGLRRVKGVYFAMFTLAFAEVIYLYLSNQTRITGGTTGVLAPRPDFLDNQGVAIVFAGILVVAALTAGYLLFAFYLRRGERVKGAVGIVVLATLVGYALFNLGTNIFPELQTPIYAFTVNAYSLSALVLVAAYYVAARLVRSTLGSIFTAIRENEERTSMVGYNTFVYKLLSMGISGTFAGLAGAMLGSFASFILTPDLMGATYTVNVLLYSILGGIGTLVGPVIGAFIIEFLHLNIGYVSQLVGVPSLASWWMLLLGVFYVAVVLFLPYGIVGTLSARGAQTMKQLKRALGGGA